MKVPFDIELFKKHGSKIEMLEYGNGEKPLDIWLSDVLISDKDQLFPVRTINQQKYVKSHKLNGLNGSFTRNEYDLLINIPDEIVECYQNVYFDGPSGLKYKSIEKANAYATLTKRLGINKVTINKTTGEIKSEILLV